MEQFIANILHNIMVLQKIPLNSSFIDLYASDYIRNSNSSNITGDDIRDRIGVNDTNTTESSQPQCVEFQKWERQFIPSLLAPAVVIMIMLTMFKRRKSMRLDLMWGRPGIQYPVNLMEGTDRWMAVTATFIIITYRLLWSLHNDAYRIWFDDGYGDFWGSTCILVSTKMLKVLLVMFIGYPMLECITLRKHIIINLLALLYISPWIHYTIWKYVDCNPFIYSNHSGAIMYILMDVPNMISFLILTVSYITDLITNTRRKYSNHKKYEKDKWPEEDIYDMKPIQYCKHLLHRKNIRNNEKSKIQRLKKILNMSDLQLPPRILCTMLVAATILYVFTVRGEFTSRNLWETCKQYLKLFKPMINMLDESGQLYATLSQLLDVLFWSFYVALWWTCLLHMAFIIHMVIVYRKHMRQMLKGQLHGHLIEVESPFNAMISSLRYSGFQVAHLIFGFLLVGILQWGVLVAVAYIFIIPFMNWQTNFIIDAIIQLLPLVALELLITFILSMLCRFCFLQKQGKVIAMDNRRLYHVTSFYSFYITILSGLNSFLKRTIVSISCSILLVSRLDRSLLVKGFGTIDSGYRTYLGMLKMDIYHNHPILRAFLILLTHHQRAKLHPVLHNKILLPVNHNIILPLTTISSSISLDKSQGILETEPPGVVQMYYPSKARLKWWKAYTLIRNPALIPDCNNKIKS